MACVSTSVISMSALAALARTYAMPARSRALSGGSDSRRATILRTASVSLSVGKGSGADGRQPDGRRGTA